MKKLILALLAVMLVLAGCGKNEQQPTASKPQIYTSFYAVYDFAREIGGDKVDIYNLVPSGTEPHDWEPSSQDMLALSKADVLFYNGAGMESWVTKVQESVNKESIRYIELSKGIALDGATDPHIWLDPVNVISMSEKICSTLSEIDPDNAEYYKNNFDKYKGELTALDDEYTSALANKSNNKLVVSHEAYSYLCAAYGLEQIALDGISADSEPSPSRMQEIIKLIKDNDIKYIYYEELLSPKTAQTISSETGAELLPLNPFEGVSDENAEGADYISVMKANLQNILKSTK